MDRADRRVAGLGVVLLLAGGCSVANLSYPEVLHEYDSVAVTEGSGAERRMVYRDEADVTPWYMRFVLFVPLRPVLGFVFGGSPGPTTVANPSGHARERMAVLADKAQGDLLRCGEVAMRLVPVAEADASALNRITALDGLSRMAWSLGLTLGADLADEAQWPGSGPQEADWIAALRDGRPAARPPGAAGLSGPRADLYRDALRGLSARPLAQASQRLGLLTDLTHALGDETDRELAQATAEALRQAFRHCAFWLLVDAVQGDDPTLADVRLIAMEHLHRHGGPDSVPTILALMAGSQERLRETGSRFDRDPFVRLRLVHLCGQLDPARAGRSVLLPGRAAWEPVAPVDFLAELVLREDPYYSGLRTIATEALCRSLGRPIDYDVAWVRGWYAERHKG